jgi:hypothetical protein
MSTTYDADGHRYRSAPGARCQCGGELALRDETVLVCLECGAQPDEEPVLRVGQKVTVAGIKGVCRILYLPRTTDTDGDLRAAVEDEIGGTHAVKRTLCRRVR